MNKPLRQLTKEKFDNIKLSSKQTQALQQLVYAPHSTKAPKKMLWLPRVAAVLICFITAVAVYHVYQTEQRDQLLHAIAIEAAVNHIKSKPLDLNSSSWQQISTFFNQLDFQAQPPDAKALNIMQPLLGGRYCSIQGVTALQLRFKMDSGATSTLYQGTLPPEKMQWIPDPGLGQAKAHHDLKGLSISLWQNQGLVFVFIEPSSFYK